MTGKTIGDDFQFGERSRKISSEEVGKKEDRQKKLEGVLCTETMVY